ncbi:MAG: hypothetical protein EOP38_22370 [Rubrivivax sp.]|nr:MAG: hypothetical protein EOP38_22370 [Rubrivivax sp.]
MVANLTAAFKLIYDYRAGEFPAGTEVSEDQLELLQLLCKDFQVPFSEESLETLVPQLANLDRLWNRQTMMVANTFYALIESGKTDEADRCRQKFLESCPSDWYKEIVGSL